MLVFNGMKECRLWVYTLICAKGHEHGGLHAPARGILAEMINTKLEDQLRGAIRLKHFSFKTEETYVGWYRRVDGALPRHPSG